MGDQMEKKIVLMSNSKNHTLENTLTHFQNEFLDTRYLKPHKKWEISLNQIGLHARFKNYGTSKNNKYPSLLACSRLHFTYLLNCDLFDSTVNSCNPKLSDFGDMHKFYLDERMSYTPMMLHEIFSLWITTLNHESSEARSLYTGMVTKIDMSNKMMLFGQFNFPFTDTMMTMRQMRSVLFFNVNFKAALGFADSLFDGSIFIGNEQYFWRYNSKNSLPLQLKLTSDALSLQIPNIIKIVCPNIRPFITQEGYSREIGLIVINDEDSGKYINRSFLSKEAFELEDDVIKSLDIQFKDEHDNNLRLSDGLPSTVVLHAKEATMDQFIIHVSLKKTRAFQDNAPNLFRIRLPELLTLRGNWKCAVSSVSFRNDLEIDAFMDLTFEIDGELEVNELVIRSIEESSMNDSSLYRVTKFFKVDSKL